MMLFVSQCESTLVLIAAGFLYQAVRPADGQTQFRRCYNTSVEMHCFEAQYDNANKRYLSTSFDNARKRCNDLQSTLIIIKDEETNKIVLNYTTDPYNPIRSQYVWTDAYRISDYNNTYTWHWVNSALPNLQASAVADTYDSGWYIGSLEFKSQNGGSQFRLTAQQPHLKNKFICEYEVSGCPTSGSNIRLIDDRCYVAVNASMSWYEARNRCLKDGGDLASFANVTGINFTSWLGFDPNVRFWIGLRFIWYIWIDMGWDVKFAKWVMNGPWDELCLATCSNCGDNLNWFPVDCSSSSQIYVVCHSVTPLQTTTFTTASATTLPLTTSASITTGNTQPNNIAPYSSKNEKSTERSPIALAVGVGVGVGVPVIAAIIIVIICLVRRQRSKTRETSTAREERTQTAFHSEVETGKREEVEIGHYAAIPKLSSSKSLPYEEGPPSEIQYATLGFEEATDLKNDNGQSPLDVL